MEWVLNVEVNVNYCLLTAPDGDDVLQLIVLFFPGVNEMEDVVSWKFKPLDFGRVLVQFLHNSISRWLLFVECGKESTFKEIA